ncbi:ribonuclease-like 3 [Trichomycterus rosablanca]|uniref:ribonuclease-like 3 n=1 Tax=Trichomycterus rosablanca TaxID=2290929 RepID=UPI002F35E394
MIMKICCFGLVLLLVLSAVLPSDAQPETTSQRYQRFKRNHVYGSMTVKQCTSVISKRGITEGNTNQCKDVNSFILANDNQVNAVCTGAGTPQGGDLYMSNNRFNVITCRLKSGVRHPKCEYRDGDKSHRHIVVGCTNGLPTHYAEGVIIGK